MSEEYRIVYQRGDGEITEKKSRFMATVVSVRSEEEAHAFIEARRKQYWNASHNCYAYVIGDQSQLARISDDGEPGGTAGRPILDILKGNGLHDTLAVVTRYFGGTLLGTGGLIRAYGDAVKSALSSAVIITRIAGVKLKIGTDYTGLGKIQYILGQNGIKILDTVYTENVEIYVAVEQSASQKVIAELIEATNGQVRIEQEEKCFFAENGKEIIIL